MGEKFRYKGILWFCGNRLPRFGGDDGAWVYDRIVVLGCHNIIPKEKQDPLLIQKLFREREGVVYKAVMAALDVIHNGYRYSESKGQEAVRYEYRQNNNTVLGFLNECCVREDGNLNKWCSSNDLYQIYRIWCTDVGRKPKSMHEFRNTIAAELKVEVKDLTTHRKSGNFYKHIVPTEETRRRYEREIHDFIPEESAADYGELDDPELPF